MYYSTLVTLNHFLLQSEGKADDLMLDDSSNDSNDKEMVETLRSF